ncbi:MAG: carbon-nitrogen hydrolase family protein [Rhizobiaceae bacterium]
MRIAALQMNAAAGEPSLNLGRIGNAVEAAARGGAALLIAPELAVPGYGAGDDFATLAEAGDGHLAQHLDELARRHGIAIVVGFAERDGDIVYNSALFVDPAGQRAVYRKSHLYGPYERQHFEPGRPVAVTFEFGGISCGLLICYDVEFPENVRRLAQAGVKLVLVPTALPATASNRIIPEKMIPVRAFENQVFVAYVDLCGSDGRFDYGGLSTIAAPDGSVLAQAGFGDELLFAEIDTSAYAASAEANTYLADLRLS